MVNISWERW